MTSDDSSRKLQLVQEIFDFGNCVEWRFGSKLSRDTKMCVWKGDRKDGFWLIHFAFESNSGVSDPEGKRRAEFDELTQSFRERVNHYLEERHLIR